MFFPRPVSVVVGTSGLIVGPGNGWVLCFGPNTLDATTATRTNWNFSFGDDGEVYTGTLSLTESTGGRSATIAPKPSP